MPLLEIERKRVTEEIVDFPDNADENPVLLMLSSVDAGITLFAREFQPGLCSDECILSAFLTALRHACNALFLQPFDAMRFGEYTMLLRAEPPFLFCYVFRGHANDSFYRLDEFIQNLREREALLNSLKHTMSTGAIDKPVIHSIEDMASQVFKNG